MQVKGKRLTHIKPGYFNPPRGPIMVPGLHWLTVLLLGRSQSQDPLQLAHIDWWSTRRVHATTLRDQEVRTLVGRWGRKVLHVFDQGFAAALWLGALLGLGARFVLRWRSDYRLVDATGNGRLTWKIVHGKRGCSERWVWDSRRAIWAKASVLAVPVTHPEHGAQPLSLVVCLSRGACPLV